MVAEGRRISSVLRTQRPDQERTSDPCRGMKTEWAIRPCASTNSACNGSKTSTLGNLRPRTQSRACATCCAAQRSIATTRRLTEPALLFRSARTGWCSGRSMPSTVDCRRLCGTPGLGSCFPVRRTPICTFAAPLGMATNTPPGLMQCGRCSIRSRAPVRDIATTSSDKTRVLVFATVATQRKLQ